MKSRRLSDVICDNTRIEVVQRNVMEAPHNVTNPLRLCTRDLPESGTKPLLEKSPKKTSVKGTKPLPEKTPKASQEKRTKSTPKISPKQVAKTVPSRVPKALTPGLPKISPQQVRQVIQRPQQHPAQVPKGARVPKAL